MTTFREFILNEAPPGAPPGLAGPAALPPGGGPGGPPGMPPGGAPPLPPMGGPPGMGGGPPGMGGPPMPGAGAPMQQQPVMKMKAADVWEVLERVLGMQPNDPNKSQHHQATPVGPKNQNLMS